MAQQPEGSRGIVMLWRNEVPGFAADGHAFNVIRDQNGIVFLDGQVHEVSSAVDPAGRVIVPARR